MCGVGAIFVCEQFAEVPICRLIRISNVEDDRKRKQRCTDRSEKTVWYRVAAKTGVKLSLTLRFFRRKKKEGFSNRMKFSYVRWRRLEFFRIGIARIQWNWIVPRKIGVKSDLPQNRVR